VNALVAGDASVLRTARKHWTCVACSRAIEPGQHYLEYLGETHAYASGSRHCLRCAHAAGLAHHTDPIADALEYLPPRLRRVVDGAPVTLIVPEAGGGPTPDELAIATTILRLLRVARDAQRS
jgi:hypothetical protein